MYEMHTDKSSNRHAGGAGVVIQTSKGDKIECMISGKARPREGSRGWKCDSALRFVGDNKSDQR